MLMNKHSGFTVVELIVVILFLTLVGGIFYSQKAGLEASHRDTSRKTAINAIYYNLIEVVKPTLGGYPQALKAEQLKAMDSALLTDPDGKKLGEQGSDYRYEPTECNGGDICKSFTLRAELEREDVFVKQSP